MTMQDWINALDKQIAMLNKNILTDAGKVSREKAVEKAEKEFEIYRDREMKQLESDFDKVVKKILENAKE